MNQDNRSTNGQLEGECPIYQQPAANYRLPDAAACLLLPAAVAVVWAEVAAVALAAVPHHTGLDGHCACFCRVGCSCHCGCCCCRHCCCCCCCCCCLSCCCQARSRVGGDCVFTRCSALPAVAAAFRCQCCFSSIIVVFSSFVSTACESPGQRIVANACHCS